MKRTKQRPEKGGNLEKKKKTRSQKKMKVLSLNFLTCAVKACKSSSSSYPLHPRDAELVQDEIEVNPEMLVNVLPRLDWAALRTTSSEVSCSLKTPCFLFCLVVVSFHGV